MKVLIVLLFAFSILVPSFTTVEANTLVSNTDIVSCTGGGGGVDADGKSTNEVACNWCTLMKLVENVFDFLFVIFTLVAVGMVMYVGFQLVMSQGSGEAMEKGKAMFSSLVIGFVIFLSAWLIVDTIIKGLVKSDSGFGVWNELSGDCDLR